MSVHIVVVLCAIGPSVFSPQHRRVCILSSKTLKQVNRQTYNVSADSKSGLSQRSPVSSYQDSEAIVHMTQNAIIPTEHQYSHNATDTLMIANWNAKLLL